ncbi:hypothetical protein CAPTEDRAFT_197258 [Capitella teleta]|uniref:Uncharacterized protein n=1 Tax=Capitella teleta TaxID=283909 RepID=R7V891_CAPTE|nr:hypothetical protein CAPTEDRAFT_197258 [Capitella teleta]|eukprot:ELU15078.1 hypothetical protein CAPTEDRAFT_197258 [Capitella teleta]
MYLSKISLRLRYAYRENLVTINGLLYNNHNVPQFRFLGFNFTTTRALLFICNVTQEKHKRERRKTAAAAQTVSSAMPGIDAWDCDYQPEYRKEKSREHHKTEFAMSLVTGADVSSRKAAKICRKLSEEGLPIPIPSQPAVQKALIRRANELFSLRSKLLAPSKPFFYTMHHFDGKRINNREYQALVLKNSHSEIKLAVLDLNDGKAKTTTESISSVIDEYNLLD